MVTTFAMSAFAQQADKSTPANRTGCAHTSTSTNTTPPGSPATRWHARLPDRQDRQQEIEQSHPCLFKMGMNQGQIAVEAFPLGTEAAIYLGEYHLTVEGQSGALKVDCHYTAVGVHESGTCKGT
jgi:hypothetical protein